MNENEFTKTICSNNGKLYVVGGWVRDTLMNKLPKDKDYCVTGFNKEKFLSVFPHVKQVIGEKGKQTVDVFLLDVDGTVQEISLARKEVKTGKGYHGFSFHSDEFVTIEEDLKRRDITINSIAYDIEEDKYIDPYNGIADIKNGVIRATSEAFYEDPLRVYRIAVRASITGFDVEERTKKMMIKASEELHLIHKERVVKELEKAFTAEYPDKFFRLLQELGILQIHFKQVSDLFGVTQPEKYHPEGDAFEHTMQVLVAMSKQTDRVELLYSALVHDLGKGVTPKELLPNHHGHEDEGVPLVKELSEALGVPNKWKDTALFATEYHGKFHRIGEIRDIKVSDLLMKAHKNPIGIDGYAAIGLADTRRGKGDLTKEHPFYEFALKAGQEILKVKGNKEFEGIRARDDKRRRQAAIVKQMKQKYLQ